MDKTLETLSGHRRVRRALDALDGAPPSEVPQKRRRLFTALVGEPTEIRPAVAARLARHAAKTQGEHNR